jgi:hypothetical protein
MERRAHWTNGHTGAARRDVALETDGVDWRVIVWFSAKPVYMPCRSEDEAWDLVRLNLGLLHGRFERIDAPPASP